MSKVQVDTIVDKDDISAPSLTKGAIVTGVCTATSFDGAISEWVLGANGSSDYTFTGSGLTGAENDPTLYLKRGQKYRFKNSSGGHPFRIQSTANGSTGTAYNDGVTNNDAGDGTTLEWDVQFDAPDVLYYQCTSHGGMGGKIYIGNSGNSSTLVDLNVSGISTTVNLNVSGVTTTGIATVTTSVVVGSAVTANADGVITAGVGTFGSIVSGAISGTTGTYTGQLSVADKVQFTVASPQLEFNNGGPRLWSPAANTLTIHTGGGFDSASNERLRINSVGITSVQGQDDQDNFIVNCSGTEFAVHTDTTDGEVSLRAQDGTGNNYSKYMSFFTNPSGSAATERIRIGTSGEIGIAGANYGTSGQVLTSGGSGAAVSWADAGGGQWTLLETATSTSNVSTIDTLGGANGLTTYSGTYKWFKIVFYFSRSDNSEDKIGFRLSTDGSTYVTTNYRMEETWLHGGSLAYTQHANDTRYMFSSTQSRSNYMGECIFYDPFSTTRAKMFTTRMTGSRDSGTWDTMTGYSTMMNYASNDAITGIQLFTDTDYGNPFQYAFYAHA